MTCATCAALLIAQGAHPRAIMERHGLRVQGIDDYCRLFTESLEDLLNYAYHRKAMKSRGGDYEAIAWIAVSVRQLRRRNAHLPVQRRNRDALMLQDRAEPFHGRRLWRALPKF